MEKAFYFENEGKRLFAVLHSPNKKSLNKGIIFCHPYAEEKQLSHRLFVRFARELCNGGFHVLRFDCYGYGDSEGDFEETRLEIQIANTIKAIDLLEVQCGIKKPCLLGLRWGGTVAALVAERDSRVENLILWAPIINGKEYLEELIKKQMLSNLVNKNAAASKGQILEEFRSKGFFNIEGHALTMASFEEISGINLNTQVLTFKGNALIVTLKDIAGAYKSLEDLSGIYRGNGVLCELKVVEDKVFWDWQSFFEWYSPEEVYRHTLNWIIEKLGGG
jgi:exosortase A-associated hydrolase 2